MAVVECSERRRGSWALLTEYRGRVSSLPNVDMLLDVMCC